MVPSSPPTVPRVRSTRGPKLTAAVALLPACVTRKLFVNSEPPGAEVILDGRSVGTTPYEETFLSYGVRRLELRLPGYGRHIQLVDLERAEDWRIELGAPAPPIVGRRPAMTSSRRRNMSR